MDKVDNYTANVVFNEETGDHILTFPPDLIEDVGWEIGDVLKWSDNGDGTFSLRKLDDGDVNEGLSVGGEIPPEDSTGDDTSE